MKKLFYLLMLGVATFNACTKEEKKDDWTNKLTFGSGQNTSNYFELTGEGTTFSTVPGTVVFKLESKTAYDGYSIKFVVLKDGTTHGTYSFITNPKPTGHLFLTGFTFNLPGQYSVSAYIVGASETLVATGTFQMN